jgi:ketosteroid isomerase-like protein
MPKSTPAKLAYQKAFNATPKEAEKGVERRRNRRHAISDGQVAIGDNKDLAHRKALENGGSNAKTNLTVQSEKTNRGWRKGSGSYNPDKNARKK